MPWLLSLILSLLLTSSASAVTNNAPVSATIPSSNLVIDSQAPTAPILLRPLDATVTSDPRPEFVWKRSSDPNGNTVLYTLYLDGVATYLGISDLGNSSAIGYTSRIENDEIKLLPTFGLSEGEHIWQITAEDLWGNRRSSARWELNLDLTPPLLKLLSIATISNPDLSSSPTLILNEVVDIPFIILTEPYTNIFLTIVDESGQTLTTLAHTTDDSGLYTSSITLPDGIFTFLISALDRANLTTSLPSFTIDQNKKLEFPLVSTFWTPFPHTKSKYLESITAPILSYLPVTVSSLAFQFHLAVLLILLLAFIIYSLLKNLRNKAPNLSVIDQGLHPLADTTIYHSILGRRESVIYVTDHYGRVSIPSLQRGSNLTIRVNLTCHVMSISTTSTHYLLTL